MPRYFSEQLGTYIEAEPIPFTGLGAERSLIDWGNLNAVHPRLPAPPLPSTYRKWVHVDVNTCVLCERPLMPWLVKTGTRRCAICRGAKK